MSDQSAATETQSAAIGWAVVSDQAVAVGVTAVPTPVSELGSDLWFVHQYILARGINLADYQQIEIDSKAMRKVEEGSDVVVVGERGAASDGVQLLQAARFLIKLH